MLRFSLRARMVSLAAAMLASAFVACTATAPPPEAPAPLTPAPGPNSAEPATPAPAATSSSGAAAPTPSKAGPAGAMCGGIAGFGCASGLYCAFAIEAHCGAADMSGICSAVPQACSEEFAPVCACNDKTYPNACHAARDGVSVASAGECAQASLAAGATCGTRGVRGECGPGLYCNYRANCGAADEGGVCTKKPEMCTKIYAPVCGCDGKTHGSACTAASAGVSVATKGECKPR